MPSVKEQIFIDLRLSIFFDLEMPERSAFSNLTFSSFSNLYSGLCQLIFSDQSHSLIDLLKFQIVRLGKRGILSTILRVNSTSFSFSEQKTALRVHISL